jgi:hypothetical protein
MHLSARRQALREGSAITGSQNIIARNGRSDSTGRPPHVPQSEADLEEFFDLSIDLLSIIDFDGVTSSA